jgi:diguanylate cyclase (GGDEF)-like protein/PAS domain S-box-containing protein
MAFEALGVGSSSRVPVAALAAVLGDLLCGALAIRTARAPHLPAATRRLWRLLTFAIGALLVGHFLTLVGPAGPPPLWFEIPFLSYYPLVLLAVLSLPALQSPTDRWRFWLDAFTVTVAGVIGIWYVVLYPGATPVLQRPVDMAIALLYLLGDLVLLVVLATIWMRRRSLGPGMGIAFLAAAFVVDVAANILYALEVRSGTFSVGGPLSGLWLLATGLLCLSATSYHDEKPSELGPPFPLHEGPSLLPYIAILFGYGLLIAGLAEYGSQPLAGLAAGALVLTGIVVARQIAAVGDNMRLLAEATDRRSEIRFGALVAHSSDVISILEPEGRFAFVSPAVERVVGLTPGELVGTSFLELVHPGDRDKAQRLFRDRSEAASAPTGWRLRHTSGFWVFTENIVTNLLAEPAVGGLVVNTRDVSEKRRLERELTWQAFHDPLTRLPNRSVFLDRVTHALARRTRGGASLAVLFVDLDNFKLVNDTLGHVEGDRVLVSAADRLLACVRTEDTVARFGGDEFAVLIEEASTSQALEEVAQRVVAAFLPPFDLRGKETRVGASVGVAACGPGETPEGLLRKADEAMYFAKANGKGRYEVFALEMHAAVWGRLEREKELRNAIAAGELCLHYQPILRLADRSLVGFEGLLRWKHPTEGLLSPEAFIPLAEDTGLIVPIGQWVFREACRQWRLWRDEAPHLDLKVSVNASARHVQDVALVADVAAAVNEFGLPHGALILEITESMLLQHTEAIRNKLRELKTLGLSLAVDDFGTGYSSLGYLHRFPLDVLKIDKTFVEGLGSGSERPAIARAIVGLADALHLQTVAEGIETETQAASLRALGCGLGQGYYFAHPQPPEKLSLAKHVPREGDAPLG